MSFCPSLSDVSKELFLAGAHLPDQRLVTGFFMARGPQDHFREHRREIDALGRQGVNHFSAIVRIWSRFDNVVGFQRAKAIRQYICGDFFIGVQKLVKRLVPAQHHVSQDQQGPAVSQHLHGSVERAARPALWRWHFFGHVFTLTHFTCILQVRLAD
jgi:hypothetical protein